MLSLSKPTEGPPTEVAPPAHLAEGSSSTLSRVAGDVTFSLARAQDDAAIRKFLAGQAMAGLIQLEIRTDPSFFAAVARLGERADVLIARDHASHAIVGLGVRAIRHVHFGGVRRRIGHLSFLRVAAKHRRPGFLRAGYGLLQDLQKRDPVDFCLTAILKDNRAARRLLESNFRGFPRYTPLVEVRTFMLFTGARRLRTRRPTAHPHVVEKSASLRTFLSQHFLAIENAPAAPWHRLEDTDFVALEHRGSLRGAAAIWDQRSIRQTLVRRYAPALRLVRPIFNGLRRLQGNAGLPAPGPLNMAYISCLAVDSSDAAGFCELLKQLAGVARARGIMFLALSLAAEHPLAPVAATFAAHTTESILYAAHAPEQPAPRLSSAVPYVEAALL